MRPLSLSLLPLLLVACERQPVAPDQALRPQFRATHSEITGSFTEVDGPADCTADPRIGEIVLFTGQDRKSTRLNSSHGYISYAVFCLKKKKNEQSSVSLINLHI